MTFVISNTQAEGRMWASAYLCDDEKRRIISTPNQIRGLHMSREDYVYITTNKSEMLQVLAPALGGCRVHSCNEWITKQWVKKLSKKS